MPQRLTLSKTHWCSRWPSCVSTILKPSEMTLETILTR
uniref:Uncharacterized protein n=1 Tax=Anguilla anguilla TaxID=7936 RepID=A0A0E9RDQ2_ANGAN